jgi:hypothetical protein
MSIFLLPRTLSDPIKRLACLDCGTTTVLARIAPYSPGLETYTFECPQCERSESLVVKF